MTAAQIVVTLLAVALTGAALAVVALSPLYHPAHGAPMPTVAAGKLPRRGQRSPCGYRPARRVLIDTSYT